MAAISTNYGPVYPDLPFLPITFNVASFAERFTPLGPVKFVFSVFGGIVLLIIGLAFILIRHFYPGTL